FGVLDPIKRGSRSRSEHSGYPLPQSHFFNQLLLQMLATAIHAKSLTKDHKRKLQIPNQYNRKKD
ncbi:MAG: hypothetical protein ABL959_12155, partial [Pyrinomonadaceae bacterium]